MSRLRHCLSAALLASASAPVVAVAQSASIAIEPISYGAYAGTAVPIRARWTAAPGTGELVDTLVVWRSSNSLTAWVGLDGQLYFDRTGKVTLTATRAGVSASRAFEVVSPHADRLSFAENSRGTAASPLRVGDTLSLGAALWSGDRHRASDARLAYGIGVRGAAGRSARLDTAGRFSASAPGGYTVMAVLGDVGTTATVAVGDVDAGVLTPELPKDADRGDGVRDVRIGAVGDYEPYVGTSMQLLATVTGEPGTAAKAVAWTSSEPTVAWVDVDGVVHFLKRGSVAIAATAGGHRATRKFGVREPEAYRVLLRASGGRSTAVVGDSVHIDADVWVIGGARIRNVRLDYGIWAADGAVVGSRAAISEDGVFVATAPGTYTVMTAIAGHASSVVITVDAASGAVTR